MKSIFTENALAPAGHYDQAKVHNGLVYVSGQLPINPVTGEKKTGDIEDQVNAIYGEFFGEHRPARAIVPTRELHFGCKIEIDVIAVEQ